jgi:hypothetical protein
MTYPRDVARATYVKSWLCDAALTATAGIAAVSANDGSDADA